MHLPAIKTYFLGIAIAALSCRTAKQVHPTEINLAEKQLQSIPDSILRNHHIEYLNLGVNGYTIYPPLSALGESERKLNNQITTLPDAFCRLKKLKTLNLNFNNLQTLPTHFSRLENLENLDIGFNKDLNPVKEIDKLYGLKKLRYLNIMGTKATLADKDSLQQQLGSGVNIILTLKDLMQYEKQK
jgi:Leucine-rich repeat (LRR) protein